MSKIPMIGPNGTSWIETNPEPMTPEETVEWNKIHAKLDHDLTLVWQNKLAALGRPCSWKDAKALYESPFEERQEINKEYDDLMFMNTMAEACGRLEKIRRELEG